MWPSSSTTIRAVSWSIDWLMVTIMPIFIRALTTSTPLTAILCAKSATVMVSGTKTSCTTGSVGAWKACWFGSSLSFLPFLPPRTRSSSPLRALLRSRPPLPPLPLALRPWFSSSRSRRSSFLPRALCSDFPSPDAVLAFSAGLLRSPDLASLVGFES